MQMRRHPVPSEGQGRVMKGRRRHRARGSDRRCDRRRLGQSGGWSGRRCGRGAPRWQRGGRERRRDRALDDAASLRRRLHAVHVRQGKPGPGTERVAAGLRVAGTAPTHENRARRHSAAARRSARSAPGDLTVLAAHCATGCGIRSRLQARKRVVCGGSHWHAVCDVRQGSKLGRHQAGGREAGEGRHGRCAMKQEDAP